MKKTAQVDKVLIHLKYIGNITDDEAREKYRIHRLASRINDLRKEGYIIKTHYITYEDGYGQKIRYAEYELIAEPPRATNTGRLKGDEDGRLPSEDITREETNQ